MATDAELIEALKQVIDPELMVNIVDLGLIYSVSQTERKVDVVLVLALELALALDAASAAEATEAPAQTKPNAPTTAIQR